LNPAQGYLKSAKAHDKVAQWFKQLHFDEHAAQGRAQLEKELHRAHLTDVNFERLAQRFEYGEPVKLFAALGRGDLKISQILHALQQTQTPVEAAPRIAAPVRTNRARSDIYVEGEGNVLTHFARCCKPVPGDPIVGYITRGRGVTIHRPNCPNITRYHVEEPERLIEATWGRTSDATYSVDVQIVAGDRQGLLRDITSALANEKINVTATSSLSDAQSNKAFITLTLQVRDVEQLDRVLAQIRQLPSVISARRP
jgi:GTP pyrophosphokinase